MRYVMICAVLFLCVACTTTESLQSECAGLHPRFVDEVACLSEKFESEPSLKNDSFANEYILSGEVLARKVRDGSLAEDEARLSFVQQYNSLLLRQQQFNTLSAVQLDRISPRRRCDFDRHGNRSRCYRY